MGTLIAGLGLFHPACLRLGYEDPGKHLGSDGGPAGRDAASDDASLDGSHEPDGDAGPIDEGGGSGGAGTGGGSSGDAGGGGIGAGGNGGGNGGGGGAGGCDAEDPTCVQCSDAACDDAIACTDDACGPQGTCEFVNNDAACAAGELCRCAAGSGCGVQPRALSVTCTDDDVVEQAGQISTCEIQLDSDDPTGQLDCLQCPNPDADLDVGPIAELGGGYYQFELRKRDWAARNVTTGCNWGTPAVVTGSDSIEFGEVLYSSDFTTQTTGFTNYVGGIWTEAEGELTQSGCDVQIPLRALTAGGTLTDVTVQADVRGGAFCNSGGRNQVGLAVRVLPNACSGARRPFYGCVIDFSSSTEELVLVGVDDNACATSFRYPTDVPEVVSSDVWYTLTLSVTGSTLACVLSGGDLQDRVSYQRDLSFLDRAGNVAFFTYDMQGAFDNVTITLPR
jgi:hypothetical protein